MTNNTKPIIDGKSFFDYPEKEKKEIITEAAIESSKEMQKVMSTQNKNLSSDMSTNDKQLSENWIDDIDELIQSELIYSRGGQVVGIRSTLLRDKMIEYFTPQIATAVQEERKRIVEKIEEYKDSNDFADGEYTGERVSEIAEELCNDIIEAITDKE